MSGISTGTGLISGLDIGSLVESLVASQKSHIQRLQNRSKGFEAVQKGFQALEAALLPMSTSAQQFTTESHFESFQVENSDTSQLKVTSTGETQAGEYQLQALQKATSHQEISKGFANSTEQTVGTGSLTISGGGLLHQPTALETLNGGNGVRRGTMRITDRSGSSTLIDLSDAVSVDDVLGTINGNNAISVSAHTDGGRIVLTDTTGQTASDLTVSEVDGGHVAEDLGLAGSVSVDELSGSTVYEVTENFTLEQINDGNQLRLLEGAPDIRITLTDDTQIDVNLDSAATLKDVLNKINDHEDNNGKVSTALVDGRLELTDTSGGGGTSSFSVEDINDTSVVRQLGLDVSAGGTTLTGQRLDGGINSVLLRNLRGGQGIDQKGEISLTDRTGTNAVVDLSGAESLDEVLNAINSATSSGGTELQLEATIDEAGTGIEIRDTSGASANDLIISDVGGSTLASQLGIEVNAAENSVNSGPLRVRYVNEATSIENYSPDGSAVETGSISITDSAGNEAVINITSAVKNVGDVMQRINAKQDLSVRAELNDTGDGFVLVDEAGGSGDLKVEEIGGDTAADLRLLGTSVVGDDGKQRIVSRRVTEIQVEDGDTLDDVVEKINEFGGFTQASIIDDGSSFLSKRLVLTSQESGKEGELIIEEEGLDLGLSTLTEAQDALMRMGDNPETAFLITSSTNTIEKGLSGLKVEILEEGASPAQINVSRDTEKIQKSLQTFVKNYNTFIDTADQLTRYNSETEERGVLQGDGTVLRMEGRLNSFVSRNISGPEAEIQSLIDMGIRLGEGGKLVLDEDRLDSALDELPDEVTDFFLKEEDGFGAQLKTTLESFTDPFTGTLSLEDESLQSSMDSLDRRIAQLEEILQGKKERLLRQFFKMEEALGALQSQQQALSGIGSVQAPSGGALSQLM